MYSDKSAVSVLIVSASKKADDYLREVMNSGQFGPVVSVGNIAEARRKQLESPSDLVFINTPLPDDYGIEFAIQAAEDTMSGVLLFVKNDAYEQVTYKVEEYGVLTIAKPGNRQSIYQAIKLLVATRCRLLALQKRANTLEAKMKEIRLVNRAKCLLIERFKMSEQQAHKYIEKTAMDNCTKRSEIAENIIRTYES